MKNNQFRQFLNDVASLSPQQLGILQQALTAAPNQPKSNLNLESLIEHNFASDPSCPYCGNSHLQRWGIRVGRQRYRCKQCGRTFNAFTETPLARLHHDHSGQWLQYLREMTHSLTLRATAKVCGITLKTSFSWRHRFLQVIDKDQATGLEGIVELDETFFRESFKGQRQRLPRPARKRGSDKVKARRIPVMVARDREDNTVDGVLENESADALVHCLRGRISVDAIVCADASLAHESLARKLAFPLKELNTSAGKRVLEGIFHIQHVNAYHSHLKQWIRNTFHGVATKYLSHYLSWRRILSSRNTLTVGGFVTGLAEHWGVQPFRGT